MFSTVSVRTFALSSIAPFAISPAPVIILPVRGNPTPFKFLPNRDNGLIMVFVISFTPFTALVATLATPVPIFCSVLITIGFAVELCRKYTV